VKLTNQAGETETLGQTSQSCSPGACPLGYELEELDLSERPSGTYLLSVIATDGAGNLREVSRVLSLDSTPPELALAGPLAESAGMPLNTSSAKLEMSATDSDPASGGVSKLNVERDGQLVASFPSNCSSDCHEVEASYTFRSAADGADRSVKPVATTGNGAIGELRRVSCGASADCWAVGRTKYTAAEEAEGKVAEQLLERWNGAEWQTTSIPKPAGATSVTLEGISCASASACVAVGSYNNGTTQPLAELWDGAKWTAGMAALPSGATRGSLNGVSCGAAGDCWAYGKTQVTIAEMEEGKSATPFFARWNGSWQAEATAHVPGGSLPTVTAISCGSATACTAVGRYTNPQSETLPLAYTWDVAGWRFQPMPIKTEATNSSLEGVSCTAPNACAAVGYSRVESGPWQVLAEAEVPNGGSHQITVEAVDVQGNTASETIEIDVDPSSAVPPECSAEPELEPAQGVLTPSQAIDAVEETLPAAVAPTEGATTPSTEEVIDPSYSAPSPNLETVNSLTTGETAIAPDGGFTLGDAVCVAPAALTPAATEATVVNGDAALFANTAPETDTVIRPTAMGATVINSLRGPDAPDEFALRVNVSPGQDLVELPSGAVAIVEVGSEVEEVTQVPSAPEKSPADLADVELQAQSGEYELINAMDETGLEVVAVIAQPWVVLAQGGIVPALIEVVPDTETPNEYEVSVKLPETPEEAAVWPVEVITEVAGASSVNGGCSVKDSPCGGLDLNRMARYAVYWGNEEHHYARNPFYYDYKANNCTNFISQILRAGGAKFMAAYRHEDGSWWYYNFSEGGTFGDGPSGGYEDTQSWRLSDKLPRHLWRFDLAYIDSVQQPSGWTKGNIMAYDWIDSDGKGNINHLNFVVGTLEASGGREPLIANSSSPGSNYPRKPWYRVKERVELAHGSAWARFSLAARHRVANLKAKRHDPDNLYGPNGLFRG
jgi:hypothetical protein